MTSFIRKLGFNRASAVDLQPAHVDLPSGKRLHSYWTSPFLMGKSTINGHFQ